MGKGPQRARVKRGTGQQHLLDAAQKLFEQRGYRGTTTKDVASEAGVSENLIFRYFGSKSELFMASVVTRLLDILAQASEHWRTSNAYRATPEEELTRSFIHDLMDFMSDHSGSVRAVVSVLVEPPPDFDTADVRSKVASILRKLSPDARDFMAQKGLTTADPDLYVRMAIITALSNIMLLPRSYEDDNVAPSKMVIGDQLLHFMIYGLQPARGLVTTE
jgi:AcrR family transcriptional regulator